MKPLILLSAFVVIAFATSNAQQNAKKEVYPEQVSIEHNEAVKNFSSDFASTLSGGIPVDLLEQATLGFSNLAAINVQGSENLSVLNQQGYGIIGSINIQGDYNTATLNQSGSDLLSILNIKGHYNEFNMTQQGMGLQNLVFVLGSDLNFDALHTNAGFQLNQHGTGSIPLNIEQTGRALPIIIENN